MPASEKQKRLPSYAILDEEDAREAAQHTREGVYNLLPAERFWQERQPYLQKHGYQLRPRYLPGWEPSCKGTRLDPMYCEDAIMLFNQQIMDARSLKDDKFVVLKKCRTDNQESRVALYLSSITDSQNHCVPIHEILPYPFDPQLTFMIMPYLRPCQLPEFSTIGDIIDFVNQTLEGHHPVRYDYTPDGLYEVAPLPRADRSGTCFTRSSNRSTTA